MKKTLLATSILLLCAVWAAAQQTYPQAQTSQPSSTDKTTTTQGCLGRTDGGFTLTDKTGKRYELTGDTAALKDHVGHEVQIKGTKAEPSTPTGTPEATTNRIEARIDVSSLKHISETCNAKPKSESQKPPMSEEPPAPR